MAEEIRILGRSRTDADDHALELNQKNELLVAQGLPPYTEMTKRGNGYSAIATSAVAALVVRPTTTAMFTLYNGEAAGSNKCYVIDRIFTHCLVGVNAEGRFLMWACIHPAGMTAPTSELAAGATEIVGPYGKTYNGKGVLNLALACVDNGWFPWGYSTSHPAAGTLPGAGVSVDVAGRLIVPPTGGISLQVVASTNGATFCSGLSWWEEEIKLG